MRGKTVKKINKFVNDLIAQTPEEQRTKTKEQMIKEVKGFWKNSQNAKKFINHTLKGVDTNHFLEDK